MMIDYKTNHFTGWKTIDLPEIVDWDILSQCRIIEKIESLHPGCEVTQIGKHI